jgi:hypothetical protein
MFKIQRKDSKKYIIVDERNIDCSGQYFTKKTAKVVCSDMNTEWEKETVQKNIIAFLEHEIYNEESTRSYLKRVKKHINQLILNDF